MPAAYGRLERRPVRPAPGVDVRPMGKEKGYQIRAAQAGRQVQRSPAIVTLHVDVCCTAPPLREQQVPDPRGVACFERLPPGIHDLLTSWTGLRPPDTVPCRIAGQN